MLRDLKLKAVYRSDADSILEDFYIPALSASVAYDRAVGFFSASMLSYAAQGLSALIRNNGRMRLIFGGQLADEDEAAIRRGYEQRAIIERLGLEFVRSMDSVEDDLFHRRLEALSWLVATGRLDIKVALKRKGMYHEKIGILTDDAGDRVVFQGSANETTQALLPEYNFESINVFPCWREELTDHFSPYLVGFETLWAGGAKDTHVVPFPAVARERLVRMAKEARAPLTPEDEITLSTSQRCQIPDEEIPRVMPEVPAALGGNKLIIREHQKKALQAWKAVGCRGILAHATGAGKTITAIYGAVRLFEATHRLFVVIAVPYQNLADQWVEVLREFKIYAIPCYSSTARWHERLCEMVTLFQTATIDFCCAVVVNRTLQSPQFQSLLGQIPGEWMLWIGDECHHHGSTGLSQALPQLARLRLGLSATPEHYLDVEANQRLRGYYGDVVDAYTLEQALQDGVLTPYIYHVVPVELTEAETEEYLELTGKIAQLLAATGDGAAKDSSAGLEYLLLRRARVLASAKNKIIELEQLLRDQSPSPLTLFYCGDGTTEDDVAQEERRQIELVSECLFRMGWKTARFTSREPRAERNDLLNHFRLGLIDALVAIRCLDEGIDIPACRTAYILASSRNPRQQIQRRGRILRRAAGKEQAKILDFMVKLPAGAAEGEEDRNLIKRELERVAEFARLAMNRGAAVRSLLPLLREYDLAHVLA